MNLITLQKINTGAVARNLLSYGTNDGALSALYQAMRASIADENVVSVTCLMIDDDGQTSKCERYIRPSAPAQTDEQSEE